MKILIIASILLSLSAICFADMTVVERVQTGPIMGQPAQDGTTTIYIKGKKARIESSKGTFQIMDLAENKIFLVNPAKKEVMAMSADSIKQAGNMLGAMGGNAKLQVKKTGNTKTINGWKCEEYNLSSTGQFSINMNQWVTQDVDTSEFDGFKSFSDSFMRMMGASAGDEMPKGMPILTDGKLNMMGQSVATTTEVQSIKREPLADDLFTIPADYQVKEMKGMMPPQQ